MHVGLVAGAAQAIDLALMAEMATDPDNFPPRSRLFIVVPKNADAGLIQVPAGCNSKTYQTCMHQMLSCRESVRPDIAAGL